MGSYTAYSVKERIIIDIVTKLYFGVNHDISQEEWKQLAFYLLGELRAEGFYVDESSGENK